MRTIALCCVGFLAGTAAAFITQTPVLETFGYAPKPNKPATSTAAFDMSGEENVDAGANMTNHAGEANDSNEMRDSPRRAVADGTASKDFSAYAATADELPMPDESDLPEHYRLFSKGTFVADPTAPYRLPFRLLKPTKIVPGKRYPLTVFLHGAGERGSNNYSQLEHGSKEFVQWIKKSRKDSYVLFPQCPLEEQWADHFWYETEHTVKPTPSPSMRSLLALIDDIRANEPIDDKHIFAAGLSMGGFGVYDLIGRRPGLVSAGVAICGGSDCSPQFVQKLASTRMYVVHGRVDEIVSVKNSRAIVAALKQAGATPKYLELAGIGHDSWTTTLGKDDMFEWLYAGVKPSDAKMPEVKVASNPVPRKIKNRFVRPQTSTKTTPNKELAGASSKAPSIRPKKKSMIKQEVVVAKPPIKDIKPAAVDLKAPVAKTKPPVVKPKAMVKPKVMAKAKPSTKTSPVTKTTPLVNSKDVAKSMKTPEAAVKKPNPLSGQWQVTKAIHAGRVLSKKQTKAMAMEFIDGNIVIKHGKKRETGKFEIGKIAVSDDADFAELEIKSSRENMPPIKGFYTRNGDIVTMVWGAPGAKRPDPNVGAEIEAARTLTLQPSDVN